MFKTRYFLLRHHKTQPPFRLVHCSEYTTEVCLHSIRKGWGREKVPCLTLNPTQHLLDSVNIYWDWGTCRVMPHAVFLWFLCGLTNCNLHWNVFYFYANNTASKLTTISATCIYCVYFLSTLQLFGNCILHYFSQVCYSTVLTLQHTTKRILEFYQFTYINEC